MFKVMKVNLDQCSPSYIPLIKIFGDGSVVIANHFSNKTAANVNFLINAKLHIYNLENLNFLININKSNVYRAFTPMLHRHKISLQ